jgi:hypothetical protein
MQTGGGGACFVLSVLIRPEDGGSTCVNLKVGCPSNGCKVDTTDGVVVTWRCCPLKGCGSSPGAQKDKEVARQPTPDCSGPVKCSAVPVVYLREAGKT